MAVKIFPFSTLLNHIGTGILHSLKYDIPPGRQVSKPLKIIPSFALPVATVVLSFLMLKMAPLVFWSNTVALAYKFFVAFCDYQSYKQAYDSVSSMACSLPETPLLIRTVLLLILIGVLIVVAGLSIAVPTAITPNALWLICATLNIIVTCIIEIIDALVAVYDAQISIPVQVSK